MPTNSKSDTGNKTIVEEVSDADLEGVSGGPNRRAHDHIGNFNFKLEIEGVTQIETPEFQNSQKKGS